MVEGKGDGDNGREKKERYLRVRDSTYWSEFKNPKTLEIIRKGKKGDRKRLSTVLEGYGRSQVGDFFLRSSCLGTTFDPWKGHGK